MQSELAVNNCRINGIKMNFNLNSLTYGSLAFQPSVPEIFAKWLVTGSKAHYTEGAFGKILLQEIHLGELTILYNVYEIHEDLAVDFSCHPGMMQTHAALKNDSHYNIKGVGELYLAEGQFNILDATDVEGTGFMEAGKEYRSLHVIYPPEMLDELLPVFPNLEEWFASDSPQPRLLFKSHPLLSVQLKDIIDSIIHCSYTGELRRLYLELKIQEFLFLSMVPTGQEITPSVRLSRRSMELIRESKRVLEKNVDQHTTIAAIAKQLGINEVKLKAGFKKIFGISMFEYLMQTRMQIARNLLLETDKPIKEIAQLTGYATKQSFLNAFKKYFHDTPGSFRKV